MCPVPSSHSPVVDSQPPLRPNPRPQTLSRVESLSREGGGSKRGIRSISSTNIKIIIDPKEIRDAQNSQTSATKIDYKKVDITVSSLVSEVIWLKITFQCVGSRSLDAETARCRIEWKFQTNKREIVGTTYCVVASIRRGRRGSGHLLKRNLFIPDILPTTFLQHYDILYAS